MPPIPEPRHSATTLRRRLERRDLAASRVIAESLPHPRWFTMPLGLLSLSANYGFLWFAIAAVPWACDAPRALRTFILAAGSVLGAEIVTGIVKRRIGRQRPPVADPEATQQIPLPHSHSFPSSHASMGMAGLLTMGWLYPGWLPALATLVAVLAFSRVYLGVHYVADVLAGLVFGTLLGAVFVALFATLPT
jgi:undecaprenyl-diphosphatase